MENVKTVLKEENGTKTKSFISRLKEKKAKITVQIATFLISSCSLAVSAFAAEGEEGNTGEEAFNTVVDFFATWIGRIGLVVAFIGGIMFAFSVKTDDPEGKTRALLTLGSGFLVFAITKALDMFMGVS